MAQAHYKKMGRFRVMVDLEPEEYQALRAFQEKDFSSFRPIMRKALRTYLEANGFPVKEPGDYKEPKLKEVGSRKKGKEA